MFGKIIDIYKFFGKEEKLKLLYTQFLILIASVFEILSIFSVGPLIQILSNRRGIDSSILSDQQDISNVIQDQVKNMKFQ